MAKSIINTISSESFAKIVKEHNSICEILECFGFCRTSGGMSKIVKDRILREGLDVSHFNKGNANGGKPMYDLKDILVENSRYFNIDRLKKRLLKANLLEYKCEKCGNVGVWNGKPLALQLEHKNGKHNDHRLSNLCFLCPNCHSQTDTFAGKNADKTKLWNSNL